VKNKKSMVINQFHSIGDILFIEPICRHIWKTTGQKPVLPVRDHLMYLSEYIESAIFVRLSEFTFDQDSMSMENPNYLPLRFANQVIRKLSPHDHSDLENMMLDKYTLAKMDPSLWIGIDLKFNNARALKLMKLLGITQSSKYILVNNYSQAGKVKIKPFNAHKFQVIEMKEIPGFSVIDWHLVILYAQENHHVSTSTFYLMQAIKNKFNFDSRVFLYPRPSEDGLRGISKLNPTYKFIKCELE
jgi:hypothetical protein